MFRHPSGVNETESLSTVRNHPNGGSLESLVLMRCEQHINSLKVFTKVHDLWPILGPTCIFSKGGADLSIGLSSNEPDWQTLFPREEATGNPNMDLAPEDLLVRSIHSCFRMEDHHTSSDHAKWILVNLVSIPGDSTRLDLTSLTRRGADNFSYPREMSANRRACAYFNVLHTM